MNWMTISQFHPQILFTLYINVHIHLCILKIHVIHLHKMIKPTKFKANQYHLHFIKFFTSNWACLFNTGHWPLVLKTIKTCSGVLSLPIQLHEKILEKESAQWRMDGWIDGYTKLINGAGPDMYPWQIQQQVELAHWLLLLHNELGRISSSFPPRFFSATSLLQQMGQSLAR